MNPSQTDVILLDFSKAFDKVPHQRLLHKLEFYGVRSSLHRWTSSFLRDRSQQVLLDGTTSTSASVQSGVPQGSVLGTLLLLLFINDLPEYISQDSTARLFADDCILYRNIETECDTRDFPHDLDRLQQWEKDWLMEFHPPKCQVLHITTKRKPIQTPYTKFHVKLKSLLRHGFHNLSFMVTKCINLTKLLAQIFRAVY